MDQSSNDTSTPRSSKGHVAVRLEERTIARLDALVPRYELPGCKAARVDALRAVIVVGLEAEERREARRRRRGATGALPEAPASAPSTETGPRQEHALVRLDETTLARLDALLPRYALPGLAATRSNALRCVILVGLGIEERREAGRGKRAASGKPSKAPATAPANETGSRRGHVAVRLDAATHARLDALLPLYALPGRVATSSDVLRGLILAGLEVEERRASRRPPHSP
jgi:hypothetical protein